MRGKYFMAEDEIKSLHEIISKDIEDIRHKRVEEVDYTDKNICPSNIRRILEDCLHFEFLENEDNGWEHDNWSYFKDPSTGDIFILFYCGELFSLRLYLYEPED